VSAFEHILPADHKKLTRKLLRACHWWAASSAPRMDGRWSCLIHV